MPGCLVVFEGPEGSGKTTQLRSIAAWLAGTHEVCVTREPGGTSVAEAIRGVVLAHRDEPREPTTDAFLMNAARADVVRRVIRPALDRGRVVLSDRYAASTRAYQGAGDGVPDDWLQELERLATGGLLPDRYVLFDLDVEVGLARRRGDGDVNAMDQRALAFHRRVRDGYLAMAGGEPARWSVVDASAPPEAVQAVLRTVVADVLRSLGMAVPT